MHASHKLVKTYMKLAEEPSNVCNVAFQEFVEHNHVGLLSEEDVVREVLNDLCNDHQAPTQHRDAFLRKFNIHCFRSDDSRGNKAVIEGSMYIEPL